ncbi:MAG: hypothetical protein ABWK01_03885 [Infirmifilum sp.]
MPYEELRADEKLSHEQKRELLEKLEEIGRREIRGYFDEKTFPRSDSFRSAMGDREFMARYLLLVAILDQQAESDSARNTVIRLFTEYNKDFFLNPGNYIKRLYEVIRLARSTPYRPKSRVLRLKNEGFLLLRIGGYLLAMINIERSHGSLINYFRTADSPKTLLSLIMNDELLGGLLYEKAARMYVGWISHPDLWVDVSSKSWDPASIPMAINGHVTKVLTRAGFLEKVKVESPKSLIVEADAERKRIERMVGTIYPEGDRVMMDFGAFYVGISYCYEGEPKCEHCPLRNLCRRNIRFRAY